MAPPPATGGGGRLGAPASHMQPMQHPGIRHTQPGFMPAGRPLPNTPPAAMYGHSPGPPAPYPGNTYQHPVGYNSSNSRPYPVPQQHPHIPSQSNNHPSYGTLQNRPAGYSQAFQPKTQYNSSPQMPPMAQQGGHSHQYPAGSIGNGPHRLQSSSNPSGRAPMPQHSPSGGRGSHPGHLPQMPVPHPTGHVSGPSHPSHGPSPGYGPGPPAPGLGNHFSRPPTHFPNNSHHDRRPPPSPASQVSSPRAVTPLVQYNYSLGSFP
ncbi:hypothetical protein EDD11_006727 [Mortierella claussenii]|nr:hypothetical protein EDD11_006727 [Mortierella claussenii]